MINIIYDLDTTKQKKGDSCVQMTNYLKIWIYSQYVLNESSLQNYLLINRLKLSRNWKIPAKT